ncbi:hypothetical protein OAL35_00420 [bacterium]|nr:hypothetical protein [bacterium]
MTVSNPVDSTTQDDIVTIDRRRGDRRDAEEGSREVVAPKKQRRRHIDPTTCERDYNGGEIEFMRAMDDYKRASGRMFPTCSEVLEVIRSLGYLKLTDEQFDQLGLDVEETEDQDAVETQEDEMEKELAEL